MTIPSEAQQKIDAYLISLRRGLRGLNSETAHEIVEELRSHLVDKVSSNADTPAAVDAALAALGNPEDLASQYLTDDLLAQAEVSRSPIRILGSLFRWASLSIAGFIVLLGSLVGYFLGGALLLCAVLKPLHPHSAGLWVSRDATGDLAFSLHLGFASASSDGRDVLGWWIVPIGLLAGCGLIFLTTRVALWCARRYRKSRKLPQS